MTFDSRPPAEHIAKNEEATWDYTQIHQPKENLVGVCWVYDHEYGAGRLRTHAVFAGDTCRLPLAWGWNDTYHCYDPLYPTPQTLTGQLAALGFTDPDEQERLLFVRHAYMEGFYLS